MDRKIMKNKAQEFIEKFGKSSGDTSELSKIYAEIERVGEKCKNLIYHDDISYATKKELKKTGVYFRF